MDATLWIVIIIFGINVGATMGIPRIKPKDEEFVIKSGFDFILTCENDMSITWTYPTDDGFMANINIKSDITDDLYTSSLEITKADRINVGFYYCNETGNSNSSTFIYLYVDDDKVLAVDKKDVIFVHGKQHSPLVVPCRPTSPTVKVNLYFGIVTEKEKQPIEMNVKLEDRTVWTYDRKYGFILAYAISPMSPTYTCYFERNGISAIVIISLRVDKVYTSIQQPIITHLQDRVYDIEHEDLQLKCEVKVETGQLAQFKWKFKGVDLEEDSKYKIYHNDTLNSRLLHPFSFLTVHGISQKVDQGNYTCVVTDNDNTNENSLEILIIEKDSVFLRLTENDISYDSNCHQKCEKNWYINIESYPPANITWYDNSNKQINQSEKYTITNTCKRSILKIINVTIKDRGFFIIKASNGLKVSTLPLFLNVTAKPTIKITQANFHSAGASLTCEVLGFPKPQTKWEVKNCNDDSCKFESISALESTGEWAYTSFVNVYSSQCGYAKCYASNEFGKDEQIVSYTVADTKDAYKIIIVKDDVEITYTDTEDIYLVAGDRASFQCIVPPQNYSKDIEWYLNNTLMNEGNETIFKSIETTCSIKRSFTINNIGYKDAGSYKCHIRKMAEDESKSIEIRVSVIEPQVPKITWTNMRTSPELIFPNKYNFTCQYVGIPKASIIWLKDNEEFYPDNHRVQYQNDNQTLLFSKTEPSDEGEYTCKVENRVGSVNETIKMKFANKPSSYLPQYLVLIMFILTSIGVGTAFLFQIKKERNSKNIWGQTGITSFEKGALERINPDLHIDDQAECLPYDRKFWEIPKEQIKLDKRLGSGAFGVVVKASLKRYRSKGIPVTVAVKMIKENADDSYLKALALELKIMAYIGRHLNVVNLIGACTKHLRNGELYIIVEYCRFGNLRNYLLDHRENFINQIDPFTGKIDYNIEVDILSKTFPVRSNHSQERSPNHMLNNISNCDSILESTEILESTLPRTLLGFDNVIPLLKDNQLTMSDNSIQLVKRSTYEGHHKENLKYIWTKDLLIWAFQVSKGMEYLASRRVLHGDLAARNILLTDNNVVKICDFGLARSMYKNDNYIKKGNGPLPVKWMAIESIRDKVFSTKSDVWSFGIVLWEFFSLGCAPYPEIQTDVMLFEKLVDGYRMDSPNYATKEIYAIMLNCWEAEPLNRPSFVKLSEAIGRILENSVRKHYIDLNDPYLVMNTKRLQDAHSCYLHVKPHTSNTTQSDYTSMKPDYILNASKSDNNIVIFSELNKEVEQSELTLLPR